MDLQDLANIATVVSLFFSLGVFIHTLIYTRPQIKSLKAKVFQNETNAPVKTAFRNQGQETAIADCSFVVGDQSSQIHTQNIIHQHGLKMKDLEERLSSLQNDVLFLADKNAKKNFESNLDRVMNSP